MFFKIGALKDFAYLTGKIHVLESNKVSGLKACNFIKKKLQHRYFPVNLQNIQEHFFLQNTSGGCFLK